MKPATRRPGLAAALTGAALVATTLVVPATSAFAAVPAKAPPTAPPIVDRGLDTQDKQAVARAEQAGRPTVDLLIAARPGQAEVAARQLEALGGRLLTTDTALDYVKVAIPTGKAEAAATLGAVQAADVDRVIALDDPRPEGTTSPLPQTPPGVDTPRVNPYLPTADTGAAQYATSSDGSDGRGTTIAVLDTGIDLANPALTTTSTGARKIIDWYTATDESTDGDGTWVRMSSATYTGTFAVNGRTYVAPSTAGPFTFGIFSETAGDLGGAGSELGGDVNRDGDRNDSWGVLLDPATRQVLVDLDNDGDFTDETPMTDYPTSFDVQYFGTDDPATAVAERMPFVVQTDKAGYVNIGIPSGEHGSHVAGIAAGHALFGGQMDGAAPGANLMSIKVCLSTGGCTAAGLIDGVIYAGEHGADVVNISIGGLPALNDGNNARAELYNRTIAEYDMQIFISAGNSGPGENSVGDPAVATDAVAVGSSITKQTWLADYGSVTEAANGLHPFSSRGPREDGGFKPDIVAPGAAVSTIPTWLPGGPVPGTYALPPGYAMLNGTSMASPQAAGAAALLVATWKKAHAGTRPNAAALRTAIRSTAQPIKGVQAFAQGSGLFNVQLASAVLLAAPNTDTVTTAVPVSTIYSSLLATPGVGVGIHDREGVVQGQEYTRTYTLTRTSGASGNASYSVAWVGNDGTFVSPRSVKLPLGTPVSFPVTIRPSAVGIHSAVLRLDNTRTRGIDVQTLNTVVVPLSGASSYTAAGKIARNETTSQFVRVPSGTTAMTVTLTGGGTAAGAGQVRFLRYAPSGVPLENTSSLNCYNPDSGAGCDSGSPTSRTIANPTPGVWEIEVEARRTSDVAKAPWSLGIALLSATVSPDPDTFAATVGVPVQRSYTVTNAGAPFVGRLVGGPLGSARIATPTIADLAQQQYRIDVTAGSTSLSAAIGSASDPGADLDLFLYNCTTGGCALAAQSAGGSAEERVSVANPAAGVWIALVDGYSVPSGTTTYSYQDVFVSPSFGTVSVSDVDANRPSGSSWTVPATATVAVAPAAGRVILGSTSVVRDDGVRIGGSRIVIDPVTG